MFKPGDIITHANRAVRKIDGDRFRVIRLDLKFKYPRLYVECLDKPAQRDIFFVQLDQCKIISPTVTDTFDQDGIE